MTHSDTAASRIAIVTNRTPAPLPSFSQGVRLGDLVQISGQGSLDQDSGAVLHLGDVEAQTTLTLQHVENILAAAGGSFDDVAMIRVYLTTREHFAAMNTAYGRFISERVTDGAPPARTTVMVGLPLEGMLVEIDALARLRTIAER